MEPRLLTLTAVTLSARGVTVWPWQEPTTVQWKQTTFRSVPQNQSSSDSCSTHRSPSPEKIPDSVSAAIDTCCFSAPPNVDKTDPSHSKSAFAVSSRDPELIKSQVTSSAVMIWYRDRCTGRTGVTSPGRRCNAGVTGERNPEVSGEVPADWTRGRGSGVPLSGWLPLADYVHITF